jgi:hypothetical protein
MASDVRIWTGTAWESIKGSNGAPGPSAVSTNAGQLAKLGTDNLVLVSSTDLDARYVNVTGDTMTGVLTVSQNSGNTYVFSAVNGASYTYLNGATFTSAAFGPRPANDGFCSVRYGWSTLASGNDWGYDYSANSVTLGLRLAGSNTTKLTVSSTGNLTATGSVSGTLFVATGGRSLFTSDDSAFSVGARRSAAGGYVYFGATDDTATPGIQLSASTSAALLTISSTGNITSAATAHNFAANSITASAIAGLPAASAVAGAKITGSGVVGTSTAYARADHSHPTLDLDELRDVTVSTPATGQVLRFNGGQFVNAALAYTDLTGTPAPSAVAGLVDTISGTVGVSAAYARADHTHPFSPAVLVTASRGIAPSDMGRLLANAYTGTSTLTAIKFTLPDAGDQTIPVGSWFDLCDASANSPTAIASPAGVNLLWNASLTGGSATTVAGGTLSTLTINGMFSRLKVLKTAPLVWIVLG